MVFHLLSIFLGEIVTRSASSKRHFKPVSRGDSQGNLSETKLTTVLRLFAACANDMLWNSSLQFDGALGLRLVGKMAVYFDDTVSGGRTNGSSPG
jgi:hypothetical protein